MTFDARENSADQGRPVEIYTFARDYQQWRYTSADRDVVVDSAVYVAKAISRGEIEATSEMARSGVTLTVPRDLEVADLYRVAPPTLGITLTIRQYHEGDGEVAVIWAGRILSVEWSGLTAAIQCEPVATSLRRVGLRRPFQRQCPHVLYGAACGVNRSAHRVDGAIESVTATTVSVPDALTSPAGHFAGGYLEWDVALGIPERRFILGHTGATLELNGSTYGLQGGQAVRLFPGCDHTMATCAGKFSNSANYGGFPHIPTKNPFGGDPVY